MPRWYLQADITFEAENAADAGSKLASYFNMDGVNMAELDMTGTVSIGRVEFRTFKLVPKEAGES